jgi:hypothetical protein
LSRTGPGGNLSLESTIVMQNAGLRILTGLLVLSLAPAAWGQGRRSGRGGTRPLFPPVIDPFWATPQALLNRDFAFLRGQTYTPPARVISPPYYVTPPIYGYPVYPWPGYYSPPYGYPYPPAYQREVVIVPAPFASPPNLAPAPAAPSPERERPSGEGFYLKAPGEGESISDALDDIRKAWLNGDIERLRARFPADGKVRIYPAGRYRYSVEVRDFVQLLKEGMTRIDTTAFEFDRPTSEQSGRAFVTGRHHFLDQDRKQQDAYISYGLERIGGRWKITQAGSSSSPIARHED